MRKRLRNYFMSMLISIYNNNKIKTHTHNNNNAIENKMGWGKWGKKITSRKLKNRKGALVDFFQSIERWFCLYVWMSLRGAVCVGESGGVWLFPFSLAFPRYLLRCDHYDFDTPLRAGQGDIPYGSTSRGTSSGHPSFPGLIHTRIMVHAG